MYIDDVLSGGYSYHEGFYWKFFFKDLMGMAGWVINLDKGQLPSQQAVYLGITVDTQNMMFKLPAVKEEKILGDIAEVLAHPKVPVRKLARVTGLLQAGVRALGEPVAVCTRALYRDIQPPKEW